MAGLSAGRPGNGDVACSPVIHREPEGVSALYSLPVTAVIVNYRTPDLTIRAAKSLLSLYPALPLLIIDNGSGTGSREALEKLAAERAEGTSVVWNERNIHHGPAMDQALREARTPYVLFLDSDAEVTAGGFIEEMLKLLGSDGYAAGKLIRMNPRGFDTEGEGTPYIRPICMLIRRETYLTLPPFERHGAPCLANMKEASRRGLRLVHIDVLQYIRHEGRGTASRFGYGLGLRGRLNHLLNKMGF